MTSAECQAACAADDTCQLFEFLESPAIASGTECRHRLAGSAIASLGDVTTTTGPGVVLFEVKEGLYVAYTATDSDTIGDAVGADTTITAFADAKTACDQDAACVGFGSKAGGWRLFAGKKWEGVSTKVRVVGEAINSWIADPNL